MPTTWTKQTVSENDWDAYNGVTIAEYDVDDVYDNELDSYDSILWTDWEDFGLDIIIVDEEDLYILTLEDGITAIAIENDLDWNKDTPPNTSYTKSTPPATVWS